MRSFRSMTFLMALCLMLISPQILKGIDEVQEEAPIIAVSNGSIYAVSPRDGDARLLVERDPEQDLRLDEVYMSSRVTLSPVSPDQTRIAYTAPLTEILDEAYADNIYQLTSIGPNDLFLLDIATGEQTEITSEAADFAESVSQYKLRTYSNLTWSVDGERLYFRTVTTSLRNRAPTTMIEYYDIASGTRQTFVDFKAQTGLRGIYAIPGGLALLRTRGNDSEFELMLYTSDGQLIERQPLELVDIWGGTNGTMFTMNPVLNDGGPNYGYYEEDAEGLLKPAVLHIGSGSTLPITDDFTFPAMISHAAPETSLRLVYIDPYSERPWLVTDPDGFVQNEMRLEGPSYQWELALSPDGTRVAFIQEVELDVGSSFSLVVVDETGTHDLDFNATQIQWGAIDYIFSHVEAQG